MRTRVFLISLLVVILTTIVFLPTHSTATQSETVWVWCESDTTAPAVYFTGPFDSGLSARSTTFDTRSVARQFAEYLKGRFNTKGDATCGKGANTVDQAAALQTMRQLMAQARAQNKQVVEVSDFKYVRDETAIKATFTPSREGNTYNAVAGGLRNDHIYCVTGPFNNTVYYAEVIPLANPSSNPTPDYFRFLQQKYSFRGDLACPILNEPQAKLFLHARLAGARAGGMQIVNAGWPAAAPAPTVQVPNDRYQDNDQPAQRPGASQATPSAQVRDIASKEVTPALTFCQNDRAMSQEYDCACLQVKIYDYRVAHPAETLKGTPALASFFDGKQFECDKCINTNKAKYYARDQAKIAGLRTPAQQDCAAEKFVALLHASPIPSRAKEAVEAAIRACR
jgi:hypothetical protein